jgi:hypothetical protein
MRDSEQYQPHASTRSGGVNIADSPFAGHYPLQRESTE